MKYYHNKNVVITGSASGIGRLMALKLSKECKTLVLVDIDTVKLKAVKSEVETNGGKAVIIKCDLSKKQNIKRAISEIKKKIKTVDILINNAGIVTGKPFLKCSDNDIELTLAVNTMAPIWITKELLPGMIKNKSGHIVTVASAGGLIGTAGLADYAASKFAVIGFDESLRVELKRNKTKINTTIICPFYIDTGMFAGVKTRIPWLLPILKQEKAVKKILIAVSKRKKRLYMPWIVYTIALLRIFPTFILDGVATLLGVHDSMNEFKGRKSKTIKK